VLVNDIAASWRCRLSRSEPLILRSFSSSGVQVAPGVTPWGIPEAHAWHSDRDAAEAPPSSFQGALRQLQHRAQRGPLESPTE
ncbi:unnamed protein product, partial [Polarella glacialis]